MDVISSTMRHATCSRSKGIEEPRHSWNSWNNSVAPGRRPIRGLSGLSGLKVITGIGVIPTGATAQIIRYKSLKR
jgi:hypothetical protein